MEKPGLMLTLIFILGLSAMGCTVTGTRGVWGSGNIVTEEHEVRDFTSATFAAIGQLTIEQGEEEGLRIEAEDNLLPYFETEIHDGDLIIRQTNNVSLHPTQPVRFHLRVKSLESLAVTGSGSAVAERLTAGQFAAQLTGSGDITLGQLEAETVRMHLSGSGDIAIATLNATDLEARLTGSGDLHVTGAVRSQQVTISGASNHAAAELDSRSAIIRLTGSGSAEVRVAEQLQARLTGSGSIVYSGAPTVESTVTGSGRLSARKS